MSVIRFHLPPPSAPAAKPLTFVPLRPLPPNVVSSPSKLAADAGLRFREKLLYLERELGVDSARALALNPSIRSIPLDSLRPAADFLTSGLGLLPSDVARVFSMYPGLLTCDPDADLLPVRDFLQDAVAVPFPDLRLSVVRCPRLLVSSVPGQLRPALRFLRGLGFMGRHRITCRTTVLLVSSVESTLVPKMDYLKGLGFSYRETRGMVLRSPGLLTYSIENNLRPKVEFLIQEMGRELAELKEFPQYFSFSLNSKIKPRHQLLMENGLTMPLSGMLKVSDGEFQSRLLEMQLKLVDRNSNKLRCDRNSPAKLDQTPPAACVDN